MPRFIFTADLHLTARPCDEYRWEIFQYLKTQAKNRAAEAAFILGDLTDLKDNHSSKLVNRVVAELKDLSAVVPLYILMGNHDYVDPSNPFFSFVNELPRVRFVTEPESIKVAGAYILFMPHARRWKAPWTGRKGLKSYQFVLMHQPVKGAVGSGGHVMQGVPPGVFRAKRLRKGALVIAGDIHEPQQVGNVIYCGAPYPINFGDHYQPRVLYHDGKQLRSLARTTLQKAILSMQDSRDLKSMKHLTEGDMVRVLLHLPRSEFGDWEKHRRRIAKVCRQRGLVLCGMELKAEEPIVRSSVHSSHEFGATPKQVLKRYCRRHKVERPLAKAGKAFL